MTTVLILIVALDLEAGQQRKSALQYSVGVHGDQGQTSVCK